MCRQSFEQWCKVQRLTTVMVKVVRDLEYIYIGHGEVQSFQSDRTVVAGHHRFDCWSCGFKYLRTFKWGNFHEPDIYIQSGHQA